MKMVIIIGIHQKQYNIFGGLMGILYIYDIAYEVSLVLYNAYLSLGYEEVVDFFLSSDSQLEGALDPFGDINRDYIKKVMILIMFSNAYLINLYDIKRDVEPEYSKSIVDGLESLTSKEVLMHFFDSPMDFANIFNDSYEYLYNTYIFKYFCWDNLIKSGKKEILYRINPFAVFEVEDNDLGDGFIQTERTIQLLDDLYVKALVSVDNNATDEEHSMRVINQFKKLLLEYFANNEKGLYDFCTVLLGNVYENLYVAGLPKESSALILVLESSSVPSLVEKFLQNDFFAKTILDQFFNYNDFLEKGDLIKNRQEFIECGNKDLLAKFNPYYNYDEQVLKRQTNNDS